VPGAQRRWRAPSRAPYDGDYEALTERLERCGVTAVTNSVPGGPRQVFVEDRGGVRVEINVRRRD
jgi:hypothetical protein